MDDLTERQRLHRRTQDELVAKQNANATTFDQSILSLSTAAIGVSIAFVSDVVDPSHAIFGCLLVASWLAFVGAIAVTMFSLLYCQVVIKNLLAAAHRYYVGGDESARKESEDASRGIDQINWAAGALFLAGIVLTVLFTAINLGVAMSRESDPTPNATIPTPTDVRQAQPVNQFLPPPSSLPTEPAPAAPAVAPLQPVESE